MLLAVLVLGMLTSLLTGVETVGAAVTPDGEDCPLVGGICITSPTNITYTSNLLTLNVTVHALTPPFIYSYVMVYSVDGGDNATIPLVTTHEPVEATRTYPNGTTITVNATLFVPYKIAGCVALPELSEGSHSVTVYARYERVNYTNGNWPPLILDSSTVCFTISDEVSPVIGILSLENRTYSQGNLTLSFTTDQPASWVGYCLDEKANVTVTCNVTLTRLAKGAHNITVYAADLAGNVGASKNIYFSVEVPKPVSITIAAASVLSLAVASAGLLVYFKKRGNSASK